MKVKNVKLVLLTIVFLCYANFAVFLVNPPRIWFKIEIVEITRVSYNLQNNLTVAYQKALAVLQDHYIADMVIYYRYGLTVDSVGAKISYDSRFQDYTYTIIFYHRFEYYQNNFLDFNKILLLVNLVGLVASSLTYRVFIKEDYSS